MPREIRDLIRNLQKVGFVDRGGKGNHWNLVHPNVMKSITISGKEGDDAKHYQEKVVCLAIEEAKQRGQIWILRVLFATAATTRRRRES